VDGEPVFAFGQLVDKVAQTEGAELSLEIWRNGTTLEMSLSPRHVDLPNADGGFSSRWLIGVSGGNLIEYETEPTTLGRALTTGVEQVWTVVSSSISGLGHIITGAISSCNLSGPIGIAKASSDTASQGAASFIRFIAVLSTAVGLLNLFPIPALDGGHLVFYAYEAVVGRPPSDRAVQILMTAGIAMILSLMVFALSNDIFC
jgi:regulator of sigma E protease